mgnify:CR=1 FL=1
MRIRLLALVTMVAPLAMGGSAAASGCSADGAAIRCAGVAEPFHRDGAAAATGRLWAGRWQFIDDRGQRREGSCVLNRGIHPGATSRAVRVETHLVLDPDGRLAGYLLWRYGSATDAH